MCASTCNIFCHLLACHVDREWHFNNTLNMTLIRLHTVSSNKPHWCQHHSTDLPLFKNKEIISKQTMVSSWNPYPNIIFLILFWQYARNFIRVCPRFYEFKKAISKYSTTLIAIWKFSIHFLMMLDWITHFHKVWSLWCI